MNERAKEVSSQEKEIGYLEDQNRELMKKVKFDNLHIFLLTEFRLLQIAAIFLS